MWGIPIKIPDAAKKLKEYLDEVEDWVKNTFNVNLIHERPGLTLMGLCKK